jgi:hypothetical protein
MWKSQPRPNTLPSLPSRFTLPFMVSASEPEKNFNRQMLVGEFSSILDSKINIMLQWVSCLHFLHFARKT